MSTLDRGGAKGGTEYGCADKVAIAVIQLPMVFSTFYPSLLQLLSALSDFASTTVFTVRASLYLCGSSHLPRRCQFHIIHYSQ